MTSTATEVVRALKECGFGFFAGVPCSLLGGLVAALERDEQVRYVSATREDSAIGMAAGAYLGGRLPMVLMQNSGLGVSTNALVSLSLLYELPTLLLVSWRGETGRDAPEHLLTGRITTGTLDMLGIPHRRLESAEPVLPQVAWGKRTMLDTRRPAALLVPAGVLE